ncbi:hypothetical protein [Burkholderia glumae]|uniref:hypothetical protein n=1 Tax=Burkholderia glumae TaxID=337 RepID=UPI0021512151|nr:hypothetical protein [Burkholderia glumae]
MLDHDCLRAADWLRIAMFFILGIAHAACSVFLEPGAPCVVLLPSIRSGTIASRAAKVRRSTQRRRAPGTAHPGAPAVTGRFRLRDGPAP